MIQYLIGRQLIPEERLMLAVLTRQIDDYLVGLKTERIHYKAGRKLARGTKASTYIFDAGDESDGYVFGFAFICRYFGLDPDKLREKIRALRKKDVAEVYRRAKS